MIQVNYSLTPKTSTTMDSSSSTPSYHPILKEGDYFGELFLVLSQPLTASISTISDSILLTMKKDIFLRYLNSPIGREMISEMSIRLQGRDVPLLHILRHSR